MAAFMDELSRQQLEQEELTLALLHTRGEVARLQEREQLFSTIVQQAPAGIALIARDTLGMLRFNEAAYRSLGYDAGEFASRTLHDLAFGKPEQLDGLVERVFSEGGVEFEATSRTKAGELRDYWVSMKPLALPGRGDRHRGQRQHRGAGCRHRIGAGGIAAGSGAVEEDAVEILEPASQAADLVAREHYDLVICDMLMPGAEGFEVLRVVRSVAGQAKPLRGPSAIPSMRSDTRRASPCRRYQRPTACLWTTCY